MSHESGGVHFEGEAGRTTVTLGWVDGAGGCTRKALWLGFLRDTSRAKGREYPLEAFGVLLSSDGGLVVFFDGMERGKRDGLNEPGIVVGEDRCDVSESKSRAFAPVLVLITAQTALSGVGCQSAPTPQNDIKIKFFVGHDMTVPQVREKRSHINARSGSEVCFTQAARFSFRTLALSCCFCSIR